MVGLVGSLMAAGIALAACVYAWRQRVRLRERTASEEALRATCARLERLADRNQTILQHAMDGFFVLDDQGRFIDVNPAFGRMLGYTCDELLHKRITDVEERSGGQFNATGLRTGLHHQRSTHRHRDGRLIQLESSVVVVRDGERRMMVCFARDVTERVRAEEALVRSEEQYRNVVETSRDLIWSIDAEGRWRFLNTATREVYGYEPEEMLGRPFSDFVAAAQRDVDLGTWNALKTNPLKHLSFETVHLRRDGSQVHLSFNAIVRRAANGSVLEMIGTAQDITRRRQFEADLREANERFRAIKSGIPLGFIVWTLDGRVIEWNSGASQIFGHAESQAVGADVTELLTPVEGRAAFDSIVQQLRSGRRQSTVLQSHDHKDGSRIRCEWFSTALCDSIGQAQLVASIVRDVSERERLEGQLRHAQKMESLGVLAGGVAHDFNNLLVGIMGNASLAQKAVPEGSPARAYLNNLSRAATRATELTRHMLTYAGKAERDVRPLDINQLIQEMSELLKAAIPKRVSMQISLDPLAPRIAADAGQIQQVVMNLLINGAEACGEQPGQVRITTRSVQLTHGQAQEFAADNGPIAAGPYLALEVTDSGCGMSEETLARIFEPFYTTKFTGRGLGLSAIRGIVKAHQGAIRVRTAAGRGTTFTVLFPITPTEETGIAEAPPTHELPAGATILVIDDEPDVREVVQAMLESHGARVLTAEDGASGIHLFREQAGQIDAVLLDLTMPGLGGDAVYRELVRLRPSVRVVISSGYSEQETSARFRGAGPAGFVHKPYTADTLVRKIGAALGTSGSSSAVAAR